MMFILLAALQSAVPAPPQTVSRPADVVVTGVPLSDLQRALKECLPRRCPPQEDIARSLAYAEGQFLVGDYRASRATLASARKRNRRFAASLPIEVSGLHRATGLLSGLNGLTHLEESATFDMVDALKAGLNSADGRIMLARLEVGDMFARYGRLDDALERYRVVVGQARAAKLPVVEGAALFRRAVLLSAVASEQPIYRSTAQRAVQAVAQTTDPALAPFRNGVRLMAVMLMNKRDRDAALDGVMAGLEPIGTGRPVLAYSPPIDMQDFNFGVANGDADAQWADLGFDIGQDGRVHNIDSIRSSNKFNVKWLSVVTTSLSARRYMPMEGADGPGRHRVERYSFVSDLMTGLQAGVRGKTTSRILVRTPQRRIVTTDLTQEPGPPAFGR